MSSLWRSVKQVLEYYPRCIKLTWQASHRYALLAFIFSIFSSVVPAAQVWISKIVIDTVVQSLSNTTADITVDWFKLLSPIGGVLVIWMIGGICQSVSNTLNEQIGFYTRNYSQYLILSKASRLDLAFFETPKFFDEMEKARSEGYRANNLAVLSVRIISSAVSVILMIVLLLEVHWAAAIILLVTTTPQAIVGGYYAGKRFGLVGAVTRERRVADYLSRLLGSRDAVKEIRLFGLHSEFLRRFNDYWRKFSKQTIHLRFAQERSAFLFGLLSMVGTASIWAYAVIRAIGGHITVGDVALAFQAAERGRSGLDTLFRNLGQFYEHTIFAGNLLRFLDLDPRAIQGSLAPPPESPRPMPKKLIEGIEFRNVSFRYPHSERVVLKNLSFTIRAGESVAIVGENGAGKTTLVKLLARFYDPTEGTIYLDGCDLREYDSEELRRHIGIIFQDFVHYDFSVRENIGFGQVEFIEDQKRIARAADKGGAAELVHSLPNGFDTILGRTFDKGVDLSGGEWQKIALSRAFMREAQILILDEPTAALDALAEYEIYERFADLTAGKTTIFISHRFSTVKVAHHILVLQEGRLIEKGTHDELMLFDGQYKKMFNAQAERYK